MPPSATKAIADSVKQARRYALQCEYETAVTFYDGLDSEIVTHIANLGRHNAAPSTVEKWSQLRSSLHEEKEAIHGVMAELRAMGSAAAAVRLDRGDQPVPFGGNGGAGGPRNRDDRPVGGGLGGAAGLRRNGGNNRAGPGPGPRAPYRTDGDADDPPPKKEAPDLSAINEYLYGDRDRFGPGWTPPVGPEGHAGHAGHPGPAPQRNAMPRRDPPRRPAPAPAPKPADAADRGSRGTKDRKPPLPKGVFGKRDKDKPEGKQEGAEGKHEKFVPRPGDEALAQDIASDMTVGGTIETNFDDVAGQDEAKHLLEEAVVYPVLMPDYYQGIRRPWKGVLLYGPPGTGKTMLAKAVASLGGTTFFNVSPATLTSRWRGDSEKLVRILFEMARHYAPSTIFIDEIDSLCGERGASGEHEASRRALSVLLTQMDGVGVDQGKVVMVLGATNHPWDIDEAMRRRLEKRIYIPLPDHADRLELFKINTKSIKLADEVCFDKLSRKLEHSHYSAADITTLTREASMMVMRRFMTDDARKLELKKNPQEVGKAVADMPVTMQDFDNAIRKVPSSVNAEQLQRFEEWKKKFEIDV